jgi:hypothetical protein
MTVPRVIAVLAAAAALAGCGTERTTGAAQPPPEESTALVDSTKQPPYVNDLAIDPQDPDAFLLTTNTGFYRVADGKATRIESVVRAEGREAPIGSFLELAVMPDGTLLGSGHPDSGALPEFLGLIRSDDNGRTWESVSRLGDADFHKMIERHDRLYAWDAVLSALLVSRDRGETWEENFTPRGLVLDFEIDPDDPKVVVLSNEQQLFRTEDGGQTWRAGDQGQGIRLAWPEADRLVRIGVDGAVMHSSDSGRTWERVGEVGPAAPADFEAVSRDELYLALVDGSIVHTTDGGRSWESVFSP